MKATGSFTTIDNHPYYKISNSQTLAPFFIKIASSCDIWMFLSSIGDGGITAGRKNAEGNIFPYETEDKLNCAYESGSKTIVKVGEKIWQPFEMCGVQKYNITRNIYKSCYANSLVFEEINHDLELCYSYKLESSEKYGIVKTSKLCNLSQSEVNIELLDGFLNIMPYGVPTVLQQNSSTLVDAYKATELVGGKLAVYSMTTTINDTPHPVEMLRANIAYCTEKNAKIFIDPAVIFDFKNSEVLNHKEECYGKKGAYFAVVDAKLAAGEEKSVSFVVDCGYDHSMITGLYDFANGTDFKKLYDDIENGTKSILRIVTDADGVQHTADTTAGAAHFISTLYNLMRGGTFENGYDFNFKLFIDFLENRNKVVAKNTELLNKIKKCKTVFEFKEIAKSDADMHRLSLEYLELSFSRRHGDPTRPWNKFNIALKNEKGERAVGYEGNWRDIFQNWEALGLSYPEYYENMVAKFVNASTIEGYNPYRISNEGIDWEKPEPENPFSGLGYWGDHQIIYLLRLLQGLYSHYPDRLQNMLDTQIFSYANVPYKIKDYSDIVKDSKNTIIFDVERDKYIEKLVSTIGSDARLVLKGDSVYTVNLAEKLLVTMLCKVSNLLPGGGIWMNTQRPEWNDANNAIVGIGLSVITVYHLKAYLTFLKPLFSDNKDYFISSEVKQWLLKITEILKNANFLGNEKDILDRMGEAFCEYRNKVYADGFSGKENIASHAIEQFIEEATTLVDYTINKNSGEVFVSYNLLNEDFSFTPMKTMLEGQSAIIASGALSKEQVCKLIHMMKKELYYDKGKYHTLYPIKTTQKFYDKNNITCQFSPVEGIAEKDVNGKLHFNADITTESILLRRCETRGLSDGEIELLMAEYERVFGHRKFNGRSDVMYKFEGIGCAYWHQNAKFALGVLETAQRAYANAEDITEIYREYNNLLDGFIYRKSPSECGAFPTEPYSHTSYNKKSEQPGMTGQVKESIIMRRGELGVSVADGQISFLPEFLRQAEFDDLNEVVFSCYGVKFCYKRSDKRCVIAHTTNGVQEQNTMKLSKELSRHIFERSDFVQKVEIFINCELSR